MSFNEFEWPWWAKMIAYGVFASFGGFMGHVMRTLDNEGPVAWRRGILEGVAAGFVGVLVYMLCLASKFSMEWTGIIVGVSGWLGANASIRFLETIVFKKLGIEKSAAHPEHNDVDHTQ